MSEEFDFKTMNAHTACKAMNQAIPPLANVEAWLMTQKDKYELAVEFGNMMAAFGECHRKILKAYIADNRRKE